MGTAMRVETCQRNALPGFHAHEEPSGPRRFLLLSRVSGGQRPLLAVISRRGGEAERAGVGWAVAPRRVLGLLAVIRCSGWRPAHLRPSARPLLSARLSLSGRESLSLSARLSSLRGLHRTRRLLSARLVLPTRRPRPTRLSLLPDPPRTRRPL